MLIELERANVAAPAARRVWIAGAFAIGLVLALLVRIVLWPTAGLVGDLDQFVLWVHGIATAPFSHAYDQDMSFPPVMAYLWGAPGGARAGLPDRDDLGGPGDPGGDEDPGEPRRSRDRRA